MNPRNGNYGRGLGDWFAYRRPARAVAGGRCLEGLELEVRSTAP